MLEVMICGADDTKIVEGHFDDVVREFGGEPWHYRKGRVVHVNSANASWNFNSRATVRKADLCVFVVLEQYGEITWTVELDEALAAGKPFLLFCLRDTYQKYLTLNRSVASADAIWNTDDRRLVSMLRELEADKHLTIVPFEHGYFKDELRRQMAGLFSQTLELFETRNQRQRVISALSDLGRLGPADRQLLSSLATDEAEDKNRRKRALNTLAADGGLGDDDLHAVLESAEEGVQRLSITLLPQLATGNPADADLMDFCVQLANSSDDVGVARRLIPALFQMNLTSAMAALDSLDLSDAGTRRRLAATLEDNEEAIVGAGLRTFGAELATRCRVPSAEAGWVKRCDDLIRRLTEN
jgi:hypothetical protein